MSNTPLTPALAGQVKPSVRPLIRGMDDLRSWLEENGFRIAEDGLRNQDNEATWYAYRRSGLPARECECNEGKSMQLVVKPHHYTLRDGRTLESSEVNVTGEAGGVWFKLSAYSLPTDTLRERLSEVEANLIAAWNALRPNVGAEPHAPR